MIMINALCVRRRVACLLAVVLVILLVVACQGAVEEEVVEEAPTEESAEAPTENGEVVIVMAVPEFISGQVFFNTVVTEFMVENPDILLELDIVPPTESLAEYIARNMAEGTLADVGVLSYNGLASLVNGGQLVTLNELQSANSENFVEGALALHTFNEGLYGLPWLRSGCAPVYEVLSAFSPEADVLSASSLEKEEAIDRLFTFMTRPDVQDEFIYELSDWLPTAVDAYDAALIRSCETATAPLLPRDPDLIGEAIVQMIASAQALVEEGVLEELVEPGAAAPVTLDGEALAHVAPMANNLPDDEAGGRLESEAGLTVGALTLLDADAAELELVGNYDVVAGAYAVTCRQEDEEAEVLCTLTRPDRYEIEVFAARFQDDLPSVAVPVVTPEQGSGEGCFWLDGLKICLRIG